MPPKHFIALFNSVKPELAKFELQQLLLLKKLKLKSIKSHENLLIFSLNKKVNESLLFSFISGNAVYTKFIGESIGFCESHEKSMIFFLKKFNLDKKIKKKSFCLRLFEKSNLKKNKMHLEELICNQFDFYKFDFKNPNFLLTGFIFDDKVFFAVDGMENSLLLEKDWTFKRPHYFQASLNPEQSRLMLNLSLSYKKEFLDPFCGLGSLLIDADSLKCKIFGTEVNNRIFFQCNRNLLHYNILDAEIINEDFLLHNFNKQKFNAIATDFPYGISTTLDKKINYDDFVFQSTKKMFSLLDNNSFCVILLPINARKSIYSKFKVVFHFKEVFSSNLTRHLFVLRA